MKNFVEAAAEARETFRKEPPFIKIDSPKILVVGDTHGDVDSSEKALELGDEIGAVVVFLGDYVDRGPYQIENITILFERKAAEPDKLFLLRGNHETLTMNTYYGFLDVVSKRLGINSYRTCLEAFTQMPYALLWRNVFCVHGGLPKGLEEISQLDKLPKGEEDPEDSIGFQLLWNDPRENIRGFAESWRGGGALYFGGDVLTEFMEKNRLRLFVRSHEPMPEGYRYLFGGRLLTVFSCRYYSVPPKAAVLSADEVEMVSLS
ncbi:MAG: metallophosphoesterase [Candidatus Caldarchaeum sp.]|nr:metallophosphoesterase [Candidatus Caldarchaeum sp.]MCX8200989.1 metallophosphoesterase [Candidatus Caldarchaeum sp.]MDW8435305.1 metallophosphoesterase [Candidatus Caldarchaeum sp.]